jgi:hypothetical protein
MLSATTRTLCVLGNRHMHCNCADVQSRNTAPSASTSKLRSKMLSDPPTQIRDSPPQTFA